MKFDEWKAQQNPPAPKEKMVTAGGKQKEQKEKQIIKMEGSSISLANFSRQVNLPLTNVAKKFWAEGFSGINLNSNVTFEQARVVAERFGYELEMT